MKKELNGIDLISLLKKISNRWFFYSVLMVAAGLAGLVFGYFVPPLHESSTTFFVAIDYTQTGALTDVEEDQALRGVGSILLSDQVLTRMMMYLENDGKALTMPEFLRKSSLDREEFSWTIRYRDENPDMSKSVIRNWSKSANEIIQEALSHSIVSSLLLKKLDEMKDCLYSSHNYSQDILCGGIEPDKLIVRISEISSRIQDEKVKSLGLFNALSVFPVNQGQISTLVVRGQRNLMVLSGVMLGLILGIIYEVINTIQRRPGN